MDKRTAVGIFEGFRRKHRAFYDEVKRLHDSFPNQRGHDLGHSAHVSLVGITLADRSIRELVWLSAIPHSLDRVGGGENFESNVRNCLALVNGISNEDKEVVFDAIMKHGNLKDDNESEVLKTLKDADRIANLFLTFVIRAAQHRTNIPACEMKYLRTSNPLCPASDPASHSKPQAVFDDIRYCTTNWPRTMRTEKGKLLVESYAAELRRFMETAATQFEKIGMDQIEL